MFLTPKMEKLFLCNVECMLEEDPYVRPIEIKCRSFVHQKLDEKYCHFYHPVFGNPESNQWPRKTDIACLNCTEYFDNEPYTSVRKYDDIKNVYYVYGIFCSLNCVKGYMLEHEPALSTLRLLYFTQMCKNVYNIHYSIKPALPRMRLKKFGGDLTIEQYRAEFTSTVSCGIREPPFIQSPLQVETYSMLPQEGATDIIDKVQQKSLFDQYLEEKGTVELPLPVQPQLKKPKTEACKPKKQQQPKKKPATAVAVEKPPSKPCFNLKQLIENKKKRKQQ